MKKTAIASLLVGLMALPALARDDYRMGLGETAPRHDSGIGSVHHEGVSLSLDYTSPKVGDATTGLSGQFGAANWGGGLMIPSTDASGNMVLFGGYSFGDFQLGLEYYMFEEVMGVTPDGQPVLHGRYVMGDMAFGLGMNLESENNVLGFSYDLNDITFALDVNMPKTGDTSFDLGVGYYQDWFVGLHLSNLSSANNGDMTTALEGGYGQDNWHASLKYDLDSEGMMLHGSFMF